MSFVVNCWGYIEQNFDIIMTIVSQINNKDHMINIIILKHHKHAMILKHHIIGNILAMCNLKICQVLHLMSSNNNTLKANIQLAFT